MSPYDLPQPMDLPVAEIAGLRARVRREMEQRVQSNLFPYEGQWLTRKQLEDEQRRERRRAWVHAVELLLLYAAIAGISGLLMLILQLFVP